MVPLPIRSIGRVVASLAIAAAGGAVATAVGLPAPWLSGGAIAISIAALAGHRSDIPDPLRHLAFFFLGASLGSGVPADLLGQAALWPISLTITALALPVICLAVFGYLRGIEKWDRTTSWLASIPGALSMVVALAMQSNADLGRVVIQQSVRVVALMVVLPLAIVTINDQPASMAAEMRPLIPAELALLLGTCLIGAGLAALLRLPAPTLVGSFAASAFLFGSGTVTTATPPIAVTAATCVIAVVIGDRFAGTSWRQLVAALRVALIAFVITLSVSVAAAVLASALTGDPLPAVLLAFAPGGIEVMLVLAFSLKLDPAYVAVHQMVRFLGLMLLIPLVARWTGIGRAASNR